MRTRMAPKTRASSDTDDHSPCLTMTNTHKSLMRRSFLLSLLLCAITSCTNAEEKYASDYRTSCTADDECIVVDLARACSECDREAAVHRSSLDEVKADNQHIRDRRCRHSSQRICVALEHEAHCTDNQCEVYYPNLQEHVPGDGLLRHRRMGMPGGRGEVSVH